MSSKRFSSNIWFYLIAILVFAAILRFYGLKTAGFDYDQEYAANFAYRVVKEYPIQMIGQNLSVGGLFMGPWYFYYLTPFYILTGLHPLGGVIGSILLSLATIAVYFYVFKSVFGLKTALMAAFLRASLYSFIGNDLATTPALSADLPAILTWFCFYKFWNNRLVYLIPLSFLFGLYTSYHPILFPFYLVFLVILGFKRTLPGWKIIALAFFAFLIPLSPLIRFEYYHDFLEVKRLFSFGQDSDRSELFYTGFERFEILMGYSFVSVISNFIGSSYSRDFFLLFGRTWAGILYIPILVLMFLRIGFWKEKFHTVVLLSTYVSFIGYYFFLPVNLTEYYLLGITVLIFIYVVASLALLKTKLMLFVIVGIIAAINLNQYSKALNRTDTTSLYDKDKVVSEIKEQTAQGEQFFVSYITAPGYSFGYPYLFKIHDRVPSVDPQPRTFNIVSPTHLVGDKFDFQSGDIGLIFPK